MLKVGDLVSIDASHDAGIVKETHPHEAIVRVKIPGGHEDRKYPYESLRLDPTMNEASDFIDH